jgi:segregation and condensation protein B
MSLKAKIEAVIYASEEPVTLAQLIGLLGEEGQAELDTLAADQLTLPSEELGDGVTDAEPEIGELTEDALEADQANEPAEPASGDADALNAEVLDTSVAEEKELAQEAATAAEATEPAEPTELTPSDESSAPQGVEGGFSPLSSAQETEGASAPAEADGKLAAAAEKIRTRKLRDYFRSLLDELIAEYTSDARGLEIKEVASGFRFATKPEYHDAVRGFVKSLKPPLKLTLQALETLAVVAYKQPVTAPEISEIRGVESAGTLGSLMTRKLIQTAGRKQVIGRPMLYKTSKDFLLRFGLKDINELPSIEEFERMAGELNEAVQEEIQMEEHENLSENSEDAGSHPDADGGASEESSDNSAPLDEQHAVPEPTHIHHDAPEDLMADDSTHPEGHKHEPDQA